MHHLVMHTFLPEQKVLEGEKHLLMNLIELIHKAMKETQTCEGEIHKFANLVILKRLIWNMLHLNLQSYDKNLMILWLVMHDRKSFLKITSSGTTKVRSCGIERWVLQFWWLHLMHYCIATMRFSFEHINHKFHYFCAFGIFNFQYIFKNVRYPWLYFLRWFLFLFLCHLQLIFFLIGEITI